MVGRKGVAFCVRGWCNGPGEFMGNTPTKHGAGLWWEERDEMDENQHKWQAGKIWGVFLGAERHFGESPNDGRGGGHFT